MGLKQISEALKHQIHEIFSPVRYQWNSCHIMIFSFIVSKLRTRSNLHRISGVMNILSHHLISYISFCLLEYVDVCVDFLLRLCIVGQQERFERQGSGGNVITRLNWISKEPEHTASSPWHSVSTPRDLNSPSGKHTVTGRCVSARGRTPGEGSHPSGVIQAGCSWTLHNRFFKKTWSENIFWYHFWIPENVRLKQAGDGD